MHVQQYVIFMNTTKNKIILFDFDGVIVDSFSAAYGVNKTICPHLTEDEYRKRFEGNINEWKDSNHTPECRLDMDFFAGYVPKMEKEMAVWPGIDEVITKLEKNYGLIIVSSTLTSPIQDFMNRFGLAQHFLEIMGNDIHKSKVEKIKMVFTKYKTGPSECIFITDTLGDMREAEKTGVETIGVAWGFQTKTTLLKGNPFRIVDKPKDLIGAVSDYFNRQ